MNINRKGKWVVENDYGIQFVDSIEDIPPIHPARGKIKFTNLDTRIQHELEYTEDSHGVYEYLIKSTKKLRKKNILELAEPLKDGGYGTL